MRAMQPMLSGARALLRASCTARKHLNAKRARALLTSPGFEYWYLEPGEEVMRPALAASAVPAGQDSPRPLG